MDKKIRNYKGLAIFGLGLILPVLFLSCMNFGFALDTPANIKVTNITSDSAFVSWSSVRKADFYEVMWQIKGEVGWSYERVQTNCIQLKDLWDSQDYIVQVCALQKEGSNLYTDSDYAKKAFKTLADIPPEGELARPANFKPVFNSDKSAITITWEAVQGAAYYDICFECGTGYSPETLLKVIKTVPASETQFVYNEALPGRRIIIKIAARDEDFSNSCRWSKEVMLEY